MVALLALKVKGKLLCLEYGQLEPFVRDVRRCFANAKLYNPSTNHVHKVYYNKKGPLTHIRCGPRLCLSVFF